jgi:hypothetical protein
MEIVKKRHHLLVWREELRRKEILGTLTLMVSGRREYQQVVVMEQERTINLDVVFTRPKQNASHLLVMMDLEEHNGFREWIVQSLEIKMLEIVDLLHHV